MFCIICTDKPESGETRLANRPAHIDYVLNSPAVTCGGPFIGDDGESMCGTLIFLDVATQNEAQDWLKGDPYYQAGLFDKTEIRAWKHLMGGLKQA